MKLLFVSIKVLAKTRDMLRDIAQATGRKHYAILHDLVEREWKKINRGGK